MFSLLHLFNVCDSGSLTLVELCLPLGEFLQQVEASALSYDAIVKAGYTFGGFVAYFFFVCVANSLDY